MRGLRLWLAAAGIVLLALGSASCSDEPPGTPIAQPSTSRPPAPVPELQPGGPGEDTTTRDPDQTLEEPDAQHDDVAFMQMMVLHHRQALVMADLVPDRSDNDQVRSAAARIEVSQAPEILLMAQWLTDRSIDVPGVDEDPATYDHAEHGHAGMAGMLSGDELEELESSGGVDFDRLFLAAMVRHHEGAIEMASYVVDHGADLRVNELANGIVADQTAEIVRLEEILDSL